MQLVKVDLVHALAAKDGVELGGTSAGLGEERAAVRCWEVDARDLELGTSVVVARDDERADGRGERGGERVHVRAGEEVRVEVAEEIGRAHV